MIYAPFLANHGVVRNQLMHNTDLFVTLTKLAGVRLEPWLKLDGVDQWNVINNGGPQIRFEVVNIDDVLGFGSYIILNYKFVNGSSSNGVYDGWLASTNRHGGSSDATYAQSVINSMASQAIMSVQKKNSLSADKIFKLRREASVRCTNDVTKTPCDVTKAPCLFDIFDDPCEENNLAQSKPVLFEALKTRYAIIRTNVVPSRRKPSDPACDPSNFNGTWSWWQSDS